MTSQPPAQIYLVRASCKPPAHDREINQADRERKEISQPVSVRGFRDDKLSLEVANWRP